MDSTDLKARTKRFAVSVVQLTDVLPDTIKGRVICKQLVRCGTSVASNYRAVCRARSRKEFISKLGTVIEEADESAFWLELIVECRLAKCELAKPVLDEANQIVAIMTKSRMTAESGKNRQSKIGNLQ